jgi:uncharacterized protein YceH (UPF0502 family)
MFPAPLLVFAIPGGMELVVFLVVFFVLFGVPATLLVALGYKHVRDSASTPEDSDADRITALEDEVQELKERLDEEVGQ